MSKPQDFWNVELDENDGKTPLTMLRAQAEALSKRTQMRVRGDVVVSPTGDLPTNAQLRTDLYLWVPRLNNYRLLVLTVMSDARATYPVQLLNQLTEPAGAFECCDESQFAEALKAVLSQPETTTAVRNLYSSAGG